MENLVEIFANTLDAILGIVFLTMILGKKKSMPNWLFVVLALIVPVANVVLQKVFPDSPENNIVYILLTIFFGFVCTNGKISEKIIYVAIWNILLMACGLIFASVYGYVVRGTNGMEWEMDAIQRLHYIMGSKLNLILCTLLVMVILKKTKMKSAMPVMNAVVFVISILIGIILDIMLDYPYLDKKGKIAIGIAMVGILAINVFVYVATYQLNKSQKLLMENQLLRMSQEEQKEGMERMMRLQEKNRMLRHDLRHYFTLFQEMLANGNVEEAQKYVEDVLNTKLQPEGVYMTGDEILDAVLNHCDGICRQKQITFRTEISAHLPEGQMEFAIALLNLLENAIEAEELEEDKLIELQIYESAGLLLVTVRNRISQSVMENNPELRTRKADASLHGLGRKSVKKLIRDMECLAYAITDHLLRRDVIQKEDYDIYVYGYAVFLEQMCQVIGFILLGIVTKNLLQTALFLGTFYLIRSAFGGYHAETSLVCMLVSYGGWGAVMILSRYMEAYAEVPLVLWIVLAADLCVFAILGPVAHANKPLSAVQKKRNKRNGFLVLGIGSLLVFLWRSCVIVGTVYIGTVTFVAVLAMIGKRKVGTRYEED